MDLLERRIKKHSDRLKMKAEEAFKITGASGDLLKTKDIEREVQKFKLKVRSKLFSYAIGYNKSDASRTRYRRAWQVSRLLGNPQRSYEHAKRLPFSLV